MSKTILIVAVLALIGGGALLFLTEVADENNELPPEEEVNEDKNQNGEEVIVDSSFIDCLADAGVVIYGSSTCPACNRLEEEYGGYEVVAPIYLDCSGLGTVEETERCRSEMKTNFVPEVQIKGEVFDDWGSPENLAEEVGCEL